ncbi:MAG: hypothetical protein OEV43_07915 [Coriobacteriia bacterium]|nr:hypothetical protein [Coriobacteriia bacterium]
MSAAKKAQSAALSGSKEELAAKAAEDPVFLGEVLDALNGDNRSQRVLAARTVHALAIHAPETLRAHGNALSEALEKPEAQTRWEILGALEKIVAVDARVAEKALVSAAEEHGLHDPDSGVVRLAAFRLLGAYGATTERRSEKIWPWMEEAVRVYHGDTEFPAMLVGVIRLVTGGASDRVKLAAAETMAFDAEHSKGLVGRRAKKIVECAPKRRRRKT